MLYCTREELRVGFYVRSMILNLTYHCSNCEMPINSGILFCPLICLIIATGNTAIILGLWIVHAVWTYYCVVRCFPWLPLFQVFAHFSIPVLWNCDYFLIVISLTDRAKQFGPILKLVIGLCVLPVLLVVYPIVGILGSIVGGAAYGFLSPIFATLEAVEEGKDDKFYHCFIVCVLCFISSC